MSEIKRSIFKQRVYAKRYEVTECGRRYNLGWLIDNYEMRKPKEVASKQLIEELVIHELDISTPLLNVDDKFYIEESDMLVTITGVYRTSKDAVVYYIEPKLIEDKETLTTHNRCLESITKYEEQKEKIKELEKEKNALYQSNRHKIEILNLIGYKWWFKVFHRFDKELRSITKLNKFAKLDE